MVLISRLTSWPCLGLLALQLPSPTGGWEVTIASQADIVCSGGATFTTLGATNAANMPNMRSGDPGNAVTYCRLKQPSPVPITHVGLEYRYVVGYTESGKAGPTVSVVAQALAGATATDCAGVPPYTSPPLPIGGPSDYERYSFDRCDSADKKACYSPPVLVEVDVSSGCASSKYIAIKFENNERNVQLLLPITVRVDEPPTSWGED
jgi:hypothetical protein